MTTTTETQTKTIACGTCGRPATGRVDFWALPDPTGPTPLTRRSGDPEPLGRCTACEKLRERAAELVLSHRWLAGRYGGSVAAERIEQALAGLAILGRRVPANPSRQLLRAWAEDLAAAAGPLLWAGQWRPVAKVRHGTVNLTPYAHVTDDQCRALRKVYAKTCVVDLAVEQPPVRVAPPPLPTPPKQRPPQPVEGGCLLCGISHAEVPATQAARWIADDRRLAEQVWHLHTVPPSVIGGEGSPTPLIGHLCHDCHRAVTDYGAIGQTAMELAVVRLVGAENRWDRFTQPLSRIRAWAVLGAAPSETRFAHLDLDRIRDQLGPAPSRVTEDTGRGA